MGRRAGFTAESRFFWIRIQIFLETPCFPDLLIRMSGKCPASRTCRFACQGNRQLPGLADSHVRETVSFPDLLIRSQASLQVEFFAEGREIFGVEIQEARRLCAIKAGFLQRSFDDRFLTGI